MSDKIDKETWIKERTFESNINKRIKLIKDAADYFIKYSPSYNTDDYFKSLNVIIEASDVIKKEVINFTMQLRDIVVTEEKYGTTRPSQECYMPPRIERQRKLMAYRKQKRCKKDL